MIHQIRRSEDVGWLLRHTRAFRGGHIAELRVSRRYLYDENAGRDVLAETIVVLVIRYAVEEAKGGRIERIQRLARLSCEGVSDFSFYEQEGANSGLIDALHAEIHEGRCRFWFDQYGEVYVVCEGAELEEVCLPHRLPSRERVREWVFQAREGALPTVDWLLEQLDEAGVPCVWRPSALADERNGYAWCGLLFRGVHGAGEHRGALMVEGYASLGEAAFGIVARARDQAGEGLLEALVGVITRRFPGEGVAADSVGPVGERQGVAGTPRARLRAKKMNG